ncbi:YbaB/EbfC family nucleoid-associated protein [uncultured Streptomyces sp.]|uniref:YbaB/EbfC family nucleoid-associated protein n=1 Tax=uncultured Streptomyces sp. TaxID=174707 RepID=UPI0026240056|nr:YbaB/EbfC family nucleoid-associated protein [uncultured Streptomyces sp.]
MPRESLEPIERRIARARAELEAVQAAVARAESELRSASVTTRSRDRAVEATVGPQGQLTHLRFLDNKYRNMTATQLASSVLEAAEEGRSAMAHRVVETFEPLTRPSGDTPEFGGIDIDWERLFGDALDAGGDGRGRRSRDRLRDEIQEDDADYSPGGRPRGASRT